MTPDTSMPMSGDPSDLTALLRTLATAPDWASLCQELQHGLPRLLPATRLDIYATSAEDLVELWFTSEPGNPVSPVLLASDFNLQSWFERQGYGVVIMRPLAAAGQQSGWLVLAQTQRMLLPTLRAAAEQLVPLLALRLRYELLNAALASSSARAAKFEQGLIATHTLRLRALLASGTAHDIGNIFTTVMGHAQLLQQDLPALFQPDLHMIMRAAEDGRHLLRRLQSAAPQFSSLAEQFASLPLIIDEAVQFTRPLWERHGNIAVQMVIHDAPLVEALGVELREVLVNLIMNAIAAMPNGGAITISCAVAGDQALLTIADTGHGIALEYQDDIFQPFATTRERGSGLGLSVSRAIIEGYGGTLRVTSAPGQGATFAITLPARQPECAI